MTGTGPWMRDFVGTMMRKLQDSIDKSSESELGGNFEEALNDALAYLKPLNSLQESPTPQVPVKARKSTVVGDGSITSKEIGGVLGCKHGTVNQLAKKGLLTRLGPGIYDRTIFEQNLPRMEEVMQEKQDAAHRERVRQGKVGTPLNKEGRNG